MEDVTRTVGEAPDVVREVQFRYILDTSGNRNLQKVLLRSTSLDLLREFDDEDFILESIMSRSRLIYERAPPN